MSEADNLPAWRAVPGTYEVWFLTLTDRATGRGYWIRSTLLAPLRAAPVGGTWFARFDPADPGLTLGIHGRFGMEGMRIEDGEFHVRMGEWGVDEGGGRSGSVFASGLVSGALEGGGHRAAWDLRFATGEPTFSVLPTALSRISPTRPRTPNPATRVTGTVTVDGEVATVADAPAQQGHLVGSRHAERWAWVHAHDFPGEEAVVEGITAQRALGRGSSPFLTFFGVRFRGRWIRLWKVSPHRDFGLGTWRVDLTGRRYRLAGRIEAPARDLLRARYQDPSGAERFCHNTEIASCRLALFERRAGAFQEVALLESRGTTHAEWAGRTPAPQVEREFTEVPV